MKKDHADQMATVALCCVAIIPVAVVVEAKMPELSDPHNSIRATYVPG